MPRRPADVSRALRYGLRAAAATTTAPTATAAPLFVIAGPCVIESERATLRTAERLARLSQRLDVPVVFKASFDKANRQSYASYRGPGLGAGLEILRAVREQFGEQLLLTTDIHEGAQADAVGDVVDIVQIPALLCRQTDLIAAAARTGRVVNLKRCPYVAPETMLHAARKVVHFAAASSLSESSSPSPPPPFSPSLPVMLTDRGTALGYNDIVLDVRNLAAMRAEGALVVQDVCHAVQSSRVSSGAGVSSGGNRENVPVLARAAAAAGVDGMFFETHHDPDAALCDRSTQLPLGELEELVEEVLDIARASRWRQRRGWRRLEEAEEQHVEQAVV